MFDKSYKFKYITSKSEQFKGYEIKTHILSFKCKDNHKYLVYVEEYSYNIHIIKFCLSNHKNSKDRFKHKTNFFDAPAVIRTCIKIMLYFLKLNKKASFGFIGSNSHQESTSNTKRFRVYKQIMTLFFSPVNFFHYESSAYSLYLIINKLTEESEVLTKIQQMFKEIYITEELKG